MLETSYDAILEKGVEDGKIPHKPTNPKQRIEFIKTHFKKHPSILSSVPLYIFFKRVPELPKTREGEFRKNVNLKIQEPNRTTEINMEKLGEYSTAIDSFVDEVKKILLAK